MDPHWSYKKGWLIDVPYIMYASDRVPIVVVVLDENSIRCKGTGRGNENEYIYLACEDEWEWLIGWRLWTLVCGYRVPVGLLTGPS